MKTTQAHLSSARLRHEDDPRWLLVAKIVSSRHFSKAPLLSRFLVHVCAELLNGRQADISEYQIGIQVFDRPHGYRTVEDNIVRNYARQLRKRLAEYFADDGQLEPVRIEIPLGGYVPVFVAHDGQKSLPAVAVMGPVVASATRLLPTPSGTMLTAPSRQPGARIAWLMVYSVALISMTLGASWLLTKVRQPTGASHPLWAALFRSSQNTFVVPADCGFNIVEDLAQRKMGLADYMRGDYLRLPLPAIDTHSASDLRTQQFTSFVDLEVVSSLSRLSESNPQHLILRFPRDLRIADLKSANVILIGSIGSNPWTEVTQKNVNFRLLYHNEMQEAWISNTNPQPGEATSYASHWNEPAHQTYALITFVPNLGGTGHMLAIQGLDVAGTQAAAEMLFRGEAIAPVLKNALLPDGRLRSFQVLLESTSIESNAANSHVIGSRIY